MNGQSTTSKEDKKCPSSAHLSKRSICRTNVNYWLKKVKQTVSASGVQNASFSIRMVHQKKRVWFPLETPNRKKAAHLATEIFLFVKSHGWEAAISKYKDKKPEITETPTKPNTVGSLIEASLNHSTARDQTKAAYAKAFRRIVSAIMEFEDDPKYASRNYTGNTAWKTAVDSIKLAEITPSKVQSWRARFINSVSKGESAKRRATITTNSLIRNSKALFAKKLLPFLHEEIDLPSPLPFDDVTMAKQPSMRYSSKIDPYKILKDASKELKNEEPEVYKILLLALGCGLRISEIDLLLWDAFDFQEKILRIENSEYHQLKSEDSAGEIDLDDSMIEYFKSCKKNATDEFVIESTRKISTKTGSRKYRCSHHIAKLIKWLRSNGVTARKPIHELRKEVGSIIANEEGIFAASRYLRHSDIRITSSIYADKKKRITPSLTKNI